MVKAVARFYCLTAFFVFFGVLFSILDSLVDIRIGQVCGRCDSYGLFLLSAKVFCCYVNDTVSVDVELNFDLWDSAWSRSNTCQGETAKSFVVGSHFTLALQNVDIYACLVICSSREHLRFACWDCCVAVDKFCHNTAQNFDTQGKWSNVEQKYVLNFATKNATLDCCTNSNTFVWVDSLVWLFATKLFNCFHNRWDTCRTTNQDYAVEVAVCNAGISHCVLHRTDCAFDDTINQTFELSASDFHFQVLWTSCIRCDKWEANCCLKCGGKFNLSLFCRFLQALCCLLVLREVDAVGLFEFGNKVVDDYLVDVVATKVCVAVGCQNFEYAIANFQNGNVERTTTKVVDKNFLVFVFALVKTVSKRCSGWLVDDTKNFQSGNFACVLCCLTLSVVKVCWNCDYCLSNLFAKVCFCIRLEFCKNDCGNFLWRVCFAIDGYRVVCTHVTFDGHNCAVRVYNCLTLCNLTYKTFAVLRKTNYGWSCSVAFCIGDYDWFATFQYCNARVCCTKVNTDNFSHNISPFNLFTDLFFCLCFVLLLYSTFVVKVGFVDVKC